MSLLANKSNKNSYKKCISFAYPLKGKEPSLEV